MTTTRNRAAAAEVERVAAELRDRLSSSGLNYARAWARHRLGVAPAPSAGGTRRKRAEEELIRRIVDRELDLARSAPAPTGDNVVPLDRARRRPGPPSAA